MIKSCCDARDINPNTLSLLCISTHIHDLKGPPTFKLDEVIGPMHTCLANEIKACEEIKPPSTATLKFFIVLEKLCFDNLGLVNLIFDFHLWPFYKHLLR
jgi:hypothetical protein